MPIITMKRNRICSTTGSGIVSIKCYAVAVLMSTLVAMTSSQSGSKCPRMCFCRDVDPPLITPGDKTGSTTVFVGMLIVDCRGRSIVKVTDIKSELPVDVGELDLGQNEAAVSGSVVRSWFPSLTRLRRLRMDHGTLRRVEPQAFRNIRFVIEMIDLSHNLIEYVDRNAFRELSNLRTLRLDSNRLGITDGGLPEMAFRGIELDVLDLRSNELPSLPDALFDGVKRVTSLRLDDNRFSALNGSCLRLLRDSLRSLTVSGNQRSLAIANDAIEGFSLSVLDIRRSGVQNLLFLEHASSVESLDVGENPLGTISLVWSSALTLNCRQARLDATGQETIDGNLLSMFRSAVELDLSDNRITSIDVDEFRERVPDLRRLDLSNCSLSKLSINRLVSSLPRLEVLNISGNTLTDLDKPSALDQSTVALKVLDVSNNRIQVFPASSEPFFDKLDVIRIAGNPVHCNCESAWLRRWINGRRQRRLRPPTDNIPGAVDDVESVRCASPPSRASSQEPMTDQDVALFVCRVPSIVSQTSSIAVAENSTVVLACTADGDPAPKVHWSSPAGEVFGVTPPADRKQNRSTAIWSTRRIRRKDAGWYICNASFALSTIDLGASGSGIGSGLSLGYTYVHVIVPGELPVDLADLKYPSVPSAAAAVAMTTATIIPQSTTSSVTLKMNKASTVRIANTEDDDSYSSPTSLLVDSNEDDLPTTASRILSTELSTIPAVIVVASSQVIVGHSENFTFSVFDAPATRTMVDAGFAGSSPPTSEDRRKFLIIALSVGIGLAILLLVLTIVLIVLYIRFRDRRRTRCYRRPVPTRLTSAAVCEKYSSDDAFVTPGVHSRSTAGPGSKPATGVGSFTPGISLAPAELSSRPSRGSTDNIFTGVTFGGRGTRSVDEPSVVSGGSTERDVLLTSRRNYSGEDSASTLNA